MIGVKWEIIIFIVVSLISNNEGRKLYEDSQNDEDDSFDCNDGRKIDDPILLPFFEKLREQEMIPSKMKEWIIYFDENEEGRGNFGEEWNEAYLTENGLSKDNQSLPFGRVLYLNGVNVYLPRIKAIDDEWIEFRVMYAEQLLIDSMEKVKLYVKYDESKKNFGLISRSGTRILQKVMKRGNLSKVYVVTSSECDNKCKRAKDNPLIKLATCGSAFGKTVPLECKNPQRDILDENDFDVYKKVNEPEFQVDLPKKLKRELHKIMDWLLNRIAQRMQNYMEMAFAKNRFRKTPNDIYNKVNLQISKIRGGQTFEASKSANLIYNSLFDLNVYLNVTNTPYTFDKFSSFNRYLDFIGRFSKWQLDTTKYANFFEPLKDICLRYIGTGNLLAKPATNIFELEEGVYDLNGAICHDNVLYVINSFITINIIKSGIYDNEHCQFDTVFVIAKKNFTINENLKISGKNLVIFSPGWLIFKQQTIDLSGNNGDVGEDGDSGGDLFAFGTKFEKSELLTIISNGGDGGIGRNVTQVTDETFFKLDGNECVPIKKDDIIRKYGGSRGGEPGSFGSVTFKFIRHPAVNVTVIQRNGQKGSDGILDNIIVNCGENSGMVEVSSLLQLNRTERRKRETIKESQVFHLFRKIIRKNSRRLSYDFLSFYKDIWISPIMGQTLDSTLTDFLNASDYTNDSKQFYEITSQILHAQIKSSCNVTESQRVLLDFALTTIRMESPAEGVLPSVIDIDSYLKEVSERVGKNEISSEYFKEKESKFRKIIEEADNYLHASLIPSIQQTVQRNNNYFGKHASDYMFHDGEHFQETLVMNALLRHLLTLFRHIQLSLNHFVTDFKESYPMSEHDSNGLKKKFYFFREVRNNMTVNEMNAMQEFLKLLKSAVEDDTESQMENPCLACRKHFNQILKKWHLSPSMKEECQRIARNLASQLEMRHRSALGILNCEECKGNCESCGWCKSCQLQCASCNNCSQCPWCQKCRRRTQPQNPTCLTSSLCRQCNNCFACPDCEKCNEKRDRICAACRTCDLCPECPDCITSRDCFHCLNCASCPRCPRCRLRQVTSCTLCSDCTLCPRCAKCNAVTILENRRFFDGSYLCQRCPCSLCPACPGCHLRPEFDEIDRDDVFGWKSWHAAQPVQGKKEKNLSRQLRETSPGQKSTRNFAERYFRGGSNVNDESLGNGIENERPCEQSSVENFRLGDSRHNCLTDIVSYLDALFDSSNNTCTVKMENACSITLKSLEKMTGHRLNESTINLKCGDCNDTLDYFIEKLYAEMEKCKNDSNYDYREVDSTCSPNEGILFHIKGCDPETFYRTYDEIRTNFLNEFSEMVPDEEQQSDQLSNISKNFVYLLANVNVLLSEKISLSETTANLVLQVTDSLVKYKDLKTEYEKKMTELHDFSETDVYDLFAAEQSMQNERLDLTSRWLSQLKKLLPWIKKTTLFLSTNVNFQQVNEKILEAVRLISEIVPNVKVVEHYRHLREYMNRVKKVDKIRSKKVTELKPVFEKTFITDVFNKAVKISENWMFPLTSSLAELGKTLVDTQNETYQARLNAVAVQIENHRKSISLYTTTQSPDSKQNLTLLYKWNIRTRPTLLDDLFRGKPVILVSEILDGGKINSVTAKNFNIKLVAGRRQKEGAQEEIDDALADSWFNLTHSGISYFKFGSRIYRRLTETFTFSHEASATLGNSTSQNIDFVLSPYTTWILRFHSDDKISSEIKSKIGSIQLYGTARYVVNCGDIQDVNQKFSPLTDYRRRNGK